MKSGLLAFIILWLSTGAVKAENGPLVAAASSLRHVWPHLMVQYQQLQKPRITFGSSGNLARQIAQGAPFELLLSADEKFPAWLVENGITDQPPVIYTQGSLAWVAPAGSSLAKTLEQHNASQNQTVVIPGNVKRLAIANPAFAPYGQAAKTVLDSFDNIESITLALGENAAQALQFALSGASGGGIVPLALVSESARNKLPTVVVSEITTNQHEPLIHSMVLINRPSESTKALFDFLLSDVARSVFAQHGFKAVK